MQTRERQRQRDRDRETRTERQGERLRKLHTQGKVIKLQVDCTSQVDISRNEVPPQKKKTGKAS